MSVNTAAATQGTNVTRNNGVNTLVRFLLQASGDPASASYKLKYQKNGSGGYADVPVGSSTIYTAPTLFGTAKSPTSDNSANAGPTATITPPGSMTSGQFVVVIATYRGTSGTMTVGTTGGQSWSNATQYSSGNFRSNVFWCVFNGTWSANPTFTVTSGTNAILAYMEVWNGVDTSGGPFDVSPTSGSDAGADTTIDIADWSTSTNNAVAVNVIVSQDNNTYDTFTGGWTQAESQWRVTTTTGLSSARSYKTQATAGAVGAYSANQATLGPDAAVTWHFALKPVGVVPQVFISPSANITAGGEASTQRMSGGTGSFTTGLIWDDENGTDAIDIGSSGNTELVWCVSTQSPAAASDYFDFRVYNGNTVLDTYTATPRLTIGGSETGTGSITLGPVAVAGTGAVSRDAAGAITLGHIAVSGTGKVARDATGAITLGPVTVDGTGAVGAEETGTGAITLGPVAVGGTGERTIPSGGTVTLGPIAVSGSGTIARDGTGAVTLGPIAVAGAGNRSIVDVGGSVDLFLPAITVDGTGTVSSGVIGSGAVTLGPIAVAGTGVRHAVGTGAVSLGPMTVAGTGARGQDATGSITLGPITVSGTAEREISGIGAITLGSIIVDGTGVDTPVGTVSGSGAIALGSISVDGTGSIIAKEPPPQEGSVPGFYRGARIKKRKFGDEFSISPYLNATAESTITDTHSIEAAKAVRKNSAIHILRLFMEM